MHIFLSNSPWLVLFVCCFERLSCQNLRHLPSNLPNQHVLWFIPVMLGGRKFDVSHVLILLMCWADKWAALMSIIHRRFDWLPQDCIKPPSDANKSFRAIEKMLCHKWREPLFAMWTGLYCIDAMSDQVVRPHLCSLQIRVRKKKYIRWYCLCAV